MNVCVRIQFKAPRRDELASMRSLAQRLSDDPGSVRVFADETPGWLVAEFTMPTEAQYKAVPKIDYEMRFWADDRLDSIIQFPKTEAERASDKRKAENRRKRRREP